MEAGVCRCMAARCVDGMISFKSGFDFHKAGAVRAIYKIGIQALLRIPRSSCNG